MCFQIIFQIQYNAIRSVQCIGLIITTLVLWRQDNNVFLVICRVRQYPVARIVYL